MQGKVSPSPCSTENLLLSSGVSLVSISVSSSPPDVGKTESEEKGEQCQ